jgi:hypothetical protein
LLLQNLLLSPTLSRVESLSVNDIEATNILKPHSFGTSFAVLFGIQHWKPSPKGVIHQRGLAGGLCAEYGNTGSGIRKLSQLVTSLEEIIT